MTKDLDPHGCKLLARGIIKSAILTADWAWFTTDWAEDVFLLADLALPFPHTIPPAVYPPKETQYDNSSS